MRIHNTNLRSFTLSFGSLLSVESKWLSLMLLSAIILMMSTIMPMAQTTLDQSDPSIEAAINDALTDVQGGDFFKLSDVGHTVTYETLNIEEEMQRLLNQACPVREDDDRAAVLSECAFGPDFDFAVNEAQRDQLVSLVAAQTEIVRLKSEAAVAEQRWLTAMLIEKANAAEVAADIVIDADEMAGVMAEITELSDGLNRLSILVEGDENSTNAGLDQEVASLADRIYEIEETINVSMANSNVLAEAMFAFCDNNPDISWCRMLDTVER
tara:strand:+ start:30545 stop:31351 length:807 start_codon:yes stop_codon:yes gene_type:complete